MSKHAEIFAVAHTVAVLGMSPKPERTSHQMGVYMRVQGYDVIPVNPGHDEIAGLRCFPNLTAIDRPVDIVDVLRAAVYEEDVRDEILAMNPLPKAVWFQLNAGGFGVEDDLKARGITVFVDS
ncbi:CoA-binding protein [Planctomycetota bacterium]|nr:CoA-binding protein [Planctomycetota bacterium]